MKKSKRFKQSYRDVLSNNIEEHVYPSSRYGLRKQIVWALGFGEMWEWANNIKLSSKSLFQDLKGTL